MGKTNNWEEAQTFEEHIVDLIRRKGINSPEFHTMVRVFGKLKLREIYKKHFSKKSGEKHGENQREAVQGLRGKKAPK